METSDKNLEDGKVYDQESASDQEDDDQANESSQTAASRKRNSMSDSGSGSDQESNSDNNEDQQVAKKPKLENDHSDQSQSPTQSPVSKKKVNSFFQKVSTKYSVKIGI